MKVQSRTPAGYLTWTLPVEAEARLSQLRPDMQELVLTSFASNLATLAGAILAGFGNPAKTETLNLIMREVYEVAEANIAAPDLYGSSMS
jgi:hypothetical protein